MSAALAAYRVFLKLQSHISKEFHFSTVWKGESFRSLLYQLPLGLIFLLCTLKLHMFPVGTGQRLLLRTTLRKMSGLLVTALHYRLHLKAMRTVHNKLGKSLFQQVSTNVTTDNNTSSFSDLTLSSLTALSIKLYSTALARCLSL